MAHRFADLTTQDVAGLDLTSAVLVQPIGAVEQHGPHLPLITDALMAEKISELAVDALPGNANIWVLPTLHYGKSTEHIGWPGTITMSTDTLLSICLDVGRSLARSGFTKLVFVNGHGGQPHLLELVARDIRIECGLQVFTVMPHRFAVPNTIDVVDETYGLHGGSLETSVMLRLAPELVKMELAVDEGALLVHNLSQYEELHLEGNVTTAWMTRDLSTSGVIGNGLAGTREIGEVFVSRQVEGLAQLLLEVQKFRFADARAGEFR